MPDHLSKSCFAFLLFFTIEIMVVCVYPIAAQPVSTTPVNFKIAFIGDQALGPEAVAVLNLIKNEGAQAVLHQGDFDYTGDPSAWDAQINSVLGANFPYFASVGNHDAGDFYGTGGYQELLEARMNRLGLAWDGDLGVNSSLTYNGIFIVLTGPDVLGTAHDVYIRDQLAVDNSVWSVSSWHKNMKLMQVGGKGDDTGWEVYEESRKGGAIIATGHEHSYSRTHLLSSTQNQTVASTSDTLVLTKESSGPPFEAGKSFVFVSGLGGRSIRSQQLSGTWWASIYTSTQGADYGALFGTFNYNGNPNLARFYFKDISGIVPDVFYVVSGVEGVFLLSFNTAGSGTVDLSPDGRLYGPGTVVTLAATPSVGWSFNGWSGDLSGFANPATILMDGDKGVTANFAQIATPPQITSSPNPTATVGSPYTYDADNTVDATGTPPITFTFSGPAGFSVDAGAGLVAWTPTPAQIGTNAVSITATNSIGADTQVFDIEVSGFEVRVNAGGPDYTDTSGNLYSADQAYSVGTFGFVGGAAISLGTPVGGTVEDPLYQDIRGHLQSFEYKFDVPASGGFDVTLHMVAPTFQVGNMVMDILAEGLLVFDDLDIEEEAGGTFQALTKSFSVSVSDGTLDLQFQKVNKAAVVSAVAVAQGTLEPNIQVSPASLDFGQVASGQSSDLTLEIRNTGPAALTVNQLNLSGGPFSLVNAPGLPFLVPPSGGSTTLTLRFSPAQVGLQSENLEIVSDDPDEGSVLVTLVGEGVEKPAEVFRINAGGPNYTDTGGNLFVADQAYTASGYGFAGGIAISLNNPIGGTNEDPLYQDLRGHLQRVDYKFDVASTADFDVVLHIMAPQFGAGNIVMDVLAEGAVVFDDLNVESEAGGTFQALLKTFTASVSDGTLDLEFTSVNKAALVSAIEVIEQTASVETVEVAGRDYELAGHLPAEFELFQNQPNPFNPTTRITYHLPRDMEVTLKIYNLIGEEVRTLVDQFQRAGTQEVDWDARNSFGVRVSSGAYVYRLQGDRFSATKKMILLR